jgi:hypothetical protein
MERADEVDLLPNEQKKTQFFKEVVIFDYNLEDYHHSKLKQK